MATNSGSICGSYALSVSKLKTPVCIGIKKIILDPT